MEKCKLSDLEEKFCLVYACGPAPYNGNARKTYDLVYNGESGTVYRHPENELQEKLKTAKDINVSLEVRKLMLRDEIKDRIDQIQSESLVNATTLRPRLTESLLKIIDECSVLTVEDRFGTPLSPAPLRSVAVNAISKLTEMYGIKEDIAHKVMLEGADGDGITFNLIVPEANKENDIEKLID